MTPRNVLLMIGGALVFAAAVGGFVPLAAEGTWCGTAFVPANSLGIDDACQSLRSVVLVPLLMVAAVGAVPLFAGWSMPGLGEAEQPSTDQS